MEAYIFLFFTRACLRFLTRIQVIMVEHGMAMECTCLAGRHQEDEDRRIDQLDLY